jgi:hypothetical protein
MRDWFPVDCDLFRKPKFVAFCRTLQVSRFEAAGRLVAVWAWIQSYGPTSALDASGLDEATQTPPGTIDALIASGWATRDKRSRTLRFHWPGLTLAEQRQRCSEAGRRGNEIRWKASGGDRVAIGSRSQSKTKTKTKRPSPDGEGQANAVETASPRPPRPDESGSIEFDPATGFRLSPADRERLAAASPGIDLDGEIAKAVAWIKRKGETVTDPAAWLEVWVARARDHAGRLTKSQANGTLPLGCYRDGDGIARTASGARLWRPGDDR